MRFAMLGSGAVGGDFGAKLRRAAAHGVPVPIVATLYALLAHWAAGNPRT